MDTNNKIQITRLIDKKELINDLKAIPTPHVYIMFTEGSKQVIISQPRGLKYINHIAKN